MDVVILVFLLLSVINLRILKNILIDILHSKLLKTKQYLFSFWLYVTGKPALLSCTSTTYPYNKVKGCLFVTKDLANR